MGLNWKLKYINIYSRLPQTDFESHYSSGGTPEAKKHTKSNQLQKPNHNNRPKLDPANWWDSEDITRPPRRIGDLEGVLLPCCAAAMRSGPCVARADCFCCVCDM